MKGIIAAVTRLPKSALSGIGAGVVGTAIVATTMLGGGSDGSATLRVLTGVVQLQTDLDDAFRTARSGEVLRPVSTVRTGPDGRAELKFFDGSLTRLNYDTTFSLRELSGSADGERRILSRQTSGRTFNRVKKLTGTGSRVEVKTPNATASVRGTDFEVNVGENGDTVKVFPDTEPGNSSVVVTSNQGQQQTVTEGFKVTVTRGGDVTHPAALTSEDLDEFACFNGVGGGCQEPEEDSALLTQATATPVQTGSAQRAAAARQITEAPVVTEAPIEQLTEPEIAPEPEPTPQPLVPDPTEQPQTEPTEAPVVTTPPPPPPQQTGELSGQVTDENTGQGVAGATVTATKTSDPEDTRQTTTDENGSYQFSDLTPGEEYILTVSAENYEAEESQSAVVPSEPGQPGQTFVITPEPGTVSGTITGDGGQPPDDSKIFLDGIEQQGAVDPATGAYSISNVSAGDEHTLLATAPGYADGSRGGVTVSPAESLTGIDFQLVRNAGRLVVTVLSGFDGSAIIDATVTVDGQGPNSVAGGAYTFEDVPTGQRSVLVSAPHHQAAGEVVDVQSATVERTITLEPEPGRVSGRVTDAKTGALIADALIALDQGAGDLYSARTNGAGEFALEGVQPDQQPYDIHASADNYVGVAGTVTVGPGANVAYGDIPLRPFGSVSGVITDARSGRPISGATVAITPPGETPTTGSDGGGNYSFSMPGGDYSLIAQASGYSDSAARSVTIPEGDALTAVDFALDPLAGSISGRVIDDINGEGIVGAVVIARADDGSTLSATSGEGGAYAIGGVPTGTYDLSATADGYEGAERPGVTVGPDQDLVDHDFRLPPFGTISGTVTDARSHDAIEGATVVLTQGDSSDEVQTDAHGSYAFTVAGAVYSVAAQATNYDASEAVVVTLAAGGTQDVDFNLQPIAGTVTVTVTSDYTDGPINGATVELELVDSEEPVLSRSTNSAGQAVFSAVPTGTYDVRGGAGSHVSNNSSVTVTPNGDHTVGLRLQPQDGLVEGVITDDRSFARIANATATLVGTSLNDATDSSGQYAITGVAPRVYTLRVTAPDYGPVEVSIDVRPGPEATAQNVALTRNTGDVAGKVTNASNGQALDDAIVELNGQSQTTASNGTYGFQNVPVGTYSMTARKAGFSTATQPSVVVQANQTTIVDFSMSEALGDNELRIVLQWGTSPPDLDSHLWLPSSHRYQVYYNRKGRSTACPFATLDVDDINGEGPETITVHRAFAGTYRYGVFRYNSGNIQGSNARVAVYDEDGQLAQFTVPTGTGGWWHPFDASFNLETSEWELTPVAPANAIRTDSPEPYSDNASCNAGGN